MTHPAMPEATSARMRWPGIDMLRGLALLAMVVFHFSWDLSALRLIETDISGHPVWRLFAAGIAASFMILVGVSLVLAHRPRIRWRALGRRLAVLAAAALAVTFGTWAVFPDAFVFFGILHSIAVCSVLALPFLNAPPVLTLAAAAACFAAPHWLATPALNHPLLTWLGLGTRVPFTNDFEPVFPWLGFTLIGVAIGRVALSHLPTLPSTVADSRPARALAFAGRHSLLIYLLHQPILFGGVWVAAQVLAPSADAEVAPFLQRCETVCRETDRGAATCGTACACTLDAMRRENLWSASVRGRLGDLDRQRVAALAEQCFARSR